MPERSWPDAGFGGTVGTGEGEGCGSCEDRGDEEELSAFMVTRFDVMPRTESGERARENVKSLRRRFVWMFGVMSGIFA